jgi:hypothetical protein
MNRRVLWSNGSLIGASANLIVAGWRAKKVIRSGLHNF